MTALRLRVALSVVLGACSTTSPGPDPEAPGIALQQTPPVITNAATAAFGFTSDPAGASFVCRLDSAAFAACTSPHSVTVSDGKHGFDVAAVIGDKRSATPAHFEWTVDTVAPDTTLTGAPPARANTSEASFAFQASEPAGFECRVDDAAFAACTSGLAVTGLALELSVSPGGRRHAAARGSARTRW